MPFAIKFIFWTVEFIFNASEINISDNGNIIDASAGTATTVDNSIKITAKNFHYDKLKFTLDAFGDVEVVDLENQILIKSQKILKNVKEISVINFDQNDVIRHPLVTKIVEAYQKNQNDKS